MFTMFWPASDLLWQPDIYTTMFVYHSACISVSVFIWAQAKQRSGRAGRTGPGKRYK